MHTERSQRLFSPAEFAALMNEARRRGIALRAEAIDAFWSHLARALRSAWRAARRGMHKTISA